MNIPEKNFFSLIHPNFSVEKREKINNEPGYIFSREIENMLVNIFGYELFDEVRDGGAHTKFILPFSIIINGQAQTFAVVIKHAKYQHLNRATFEVYKVDYYPFKKDIDSVMGVADLIDFIDRKIELLYSGLFAFQDDEAPTSQDELAEMLLKKAYSPTMEAIKAKYGIHQF